MSLWLDPERTTTAADSKKPRIAAQVYWSTTLRKADAFGEPGAIKHYAHLLGNTARSYLLCVALPGNLAAMTSARFRT